MFANTSTLWAYEVLNPQIGTSKVEIWRLGYHRHHHHHHHHHHYHHHGHHHHYYYSTAILYAWGGMYMDDDANFGTNLDEVIEETDKLILGILKSPPPQQQQLLRLLLLLLPLLPLLPQQ